MNPSIVTRASKNPDVLDSTGGSFVEATTSGQGDGIQVDVLADTAAIEVAATLSGFAGANQFDLRWLGVVSNALRHRPFLLVARRDGDYKGLLPLSLVSSLLFGRFLVSLPYVNTAGALALTPEIENALINRAVELADSTNVRYLELRHEQRSNHPALTDAIVEKVHMRLALPRTSDQLWEGLTSKARNKVKKGNRQNFEICWGGTQLLDQFYEVFSHRMRDLGTPVFGKSLFRTILQEFDEAAELCVVRSGGRAIASGLLVHGDGITQVPSAASLAAFNSTNANDWMYWNLLKRTVERGQQVFDFGRCTIDGNTYAFKKKWGANPHPATWQYYIRHGSSEDMRPEGGKYGRAVQIWKRLPLWLTRLAGPPIVRGIP